MHNIVILGSGFTAINLAMTLERYFRGSSFYKIYLVSERDYLIYYPILTRFTFDLKNSEKYKKIVALSIPEIIKNKKLKFIHKPISRIDFNEQKLVFKDKDKLPFYKLIFALETTVDTGEIPGLTKYGHFLKDLKQAAETRQALNQALRSFSKKTFRLAVIGGGVAGVEAASLAKHYLSKNQNQFAVEICLLEKAPEILKELKTNSAKYLARFLQRSGIKIFSETKVQKVYKYCVEFNSGKILEYDFLLWLGGIKPHPLLETLKLAKDEKKFLLVEENYQILKKEHHYAIGDSKTTDSIRGIEKNLSEGRTLADRIYWGILQEEHKPSFAGANRVFLDFGKTSFGIQKKKINSRGFQAFWQKNFLEFQQLRSFFALSKALKIWLQILKIYLEK